jgi:hypothetical protein
VVKVPPLLVPSRVDPIAGLAHDRGAPVGGLEDATPQASPSPHAEVRVPAELSNVTLPVFTCAVAVVSRNSVELRPSSVVAFIAYAA